MPGKPRLSKEEAESIIVDAKVNGVSDSQDFKRLLSALRVQQGMKLEYLAAVMEVSPSNLTQYIDPKQSVRMPEDVFARYLEALELSSRDIQEITVIAERGGFLGRTSLNGRSAASVSYVDRFMRGTIVVDTKEEFAELIENFKLRHHQRTGQSMKSIDEAVGVQISHYSQKYNNISEETLSKFLDVVDASAEEKQAVMEVAKREEFLADPYRVAGGKRAWETRRRWQNPDEESGRSRCQGSRDCRDEDRGRGDTPDGNNPSERRTRRRIFGSGGMLDFDSLPGLDAIIVVVRDAIIENGFPFANGLPANVGKESIAR